MEVQVTEIKMSKGFQFTLPAKTRKKHGLKPGQELKVIDMDNEIILRPKMKRSVRELIGKFAEEKGFDSAKEHDIIVAGFGG